LFSLLILYQYWLVKLVIVKTTRLPLLAVCLVILLSGCLPGLGAPRDPLESREAMETQNIAEVAFHQMEIGKLQSGDYTTNVLVSLDLPQGTQWTLIALGEGSYTLRFSSAAVSDYVWLVSPAGVQLSPLQTVEN